LAPTLRKTVSFAVRYRILSPEVQANIGLSPSNKHATTAIITGKSFILIVESAFALQR